MFKEFYFLPIVGRLLTIEALIGFLVQIGSLGLVFFLLFTTERPFPQGLEGLHIYLVLAFIILGVITISSQRNTSKKLKVLITPEGLKYVTGIREIKIDFADMTRVQVTPDNTIIIYTSDIARSKSRPSFGIRNLQEQDEFLGILSANAPVDRDPKIPFAFNKPLRYFLSVVYYTLLFANILFHAENIIIITGVLLLIYFFYYFIQALKHRNWLSSPFNLSVSIFLFVVIIIRLGIIFLHHFLQKNSFHF